MEMHRDWGITPGEGEGGRGRGRGCRVKGDAEPVHISHKDWGIAGEGEGVRVKGDAGNISQKDWGITERMGRGRGRESGDAGNRSHSM